MGERAQKKGDPPTFKRISFVLYIFRFTCVSFYRTDGLKPFDRSFTEGTNQANLIIDRSGFFHNFLAFREKNRNSFTRTNNLILHVPLFREIKGNIYFQVIQTPVKLL